MKLKFILLWLPPVALMLLLVACGEDSGSQGNLPTALPTSVSMPATVPQTSDKTQQKASIEGDTDGTSERNGRDTSAQANGQDSRYPVWEKSCIGSGTVMFANSPLRIEDLNYLIPYGQVVGGHITPIDHMYFVPKGSSHENKSLGGINAYEVRAIQDGLIYDIGVRDISAERNESQLRDWRIDMGHTCTFASYFDLLTSVTPDIEEEWAKTLRDGTKRWEGIFVRAGQLIGYADMTRAVDFGVYDYEIELPGLINSAAYASREPWKIHTVDPFQYFPSEIKDALLAKMIRAVEPRSGKIDYDVAGTLSGNWFQEGTDWYMGTNQRKYWEGHLSIAPHEIDPTLWRIGIGFLDVDDNNFIIVGEHDPLQVNSSSGPVTYELKRYMNYIPAKPDLLWWNELYVEGDVFGVKLFPGIVGTVLLDLQDDGFLKMELFQGKDRERIAGFTDNSRLYQR